MTINVIKTYNLLDYDHNMITLYADLKEFIDQRFPNGINFEPNERIVFLHQDLEFFIDDNHPGLTLYNLQLILRELDIPNFFCAVVANLPHYEQNTKAIRDMLRNNDVPLRGISSLYGSASTAIPHMDQTVRLNETSIKYPFISLNRLSRFHRTFFVAKLFEHGLQDKGLLSYHNIPSSSDGNNDGVAIPCYNVDFSLLYAVPAAKFNRNIVHLKQLNNQQLVKNFCKKVKSYVNFQENTDVSNKQNSMMFQNSLLQKALIYVGSESVAVQSKPHISKISFKGIADKRPFIILAAPGILEYIRELGFRTFSHWWDESYDLESDFETRVDMIVNLLTRISLYSPGQLQQMCSDMQEVLDYNFTHLTTNFVNQEREKISSVLEKSFV